MAEFASLACPAEPLLLEIFRDEDDKAKSAVDGGARVDGST